MAKIAHNPVLVVNSDELIALSKTVNLLKEILKNEEMSNWYENNVDQNLIVTIENLDTLLDSVIVD